MSPSVSERSRVGSSASVRRAAVVAAVVLAGAFAATARAAPSVTIDSGPSGPTSDSTPTFGFTPSGATTVECSVDQGVENFGPCTSETTHTADTLADGDWIFRVRVTDDIDDSETATQAFSVDTEAPTVTIDSGPSGPTSDSTPTFGFTPEAGTTVECSVDQGTADFGPCTSGTSHTASTLADGNWTFRVRVTDAASNSDTQTRGFSRRHEACRRSRSTAGPQAQRAIPPRPSVSLRGRDDGECSVDQGTADFGPCTSGTSHTASTLADGNWTFRVRVTDAASNSNTQTRGFSVDTKHAHDHDRQRALRPNERFHPDLRFHSRAARRRSVLGRPGDGGLRAVHVGHQPHGEHARGRQLDLQGAGDRRSFELGPRRPEASPSTQACRPSRSTAGPQAQRAIPPRPSVSLPRPGRRCSARSTRARRTSGRARRAPAHAASPLAEGTWTFRVRVTDAASNSTTQTRGFSVDTSLPTITIDSWTRRADGRPNAQLRVSLPRPGRRCSAPLIKAPRPSARARSGTSHAAGPLPEGTWTFRVRVTDPGNNSVVLTQSFTVDMTGPAVAIVGPKRTGQRKPAFQVSSTEPGATFACALDSNPAVACGPTFTPRKKLKAGRHTLVATAFDALGNPGPTRTVRFKILRAPLKAGRAERTRGDRAPAPQVRQTGPREPRADLSSAEPVQVLVPVLLRVPRIQPERTRVGRAQEAHLLPVPGSGPGSDDRSSPTRTKEASRARSAGEPLRHRRRVRVPAPVRAPACAGVGAGAGGGAGSGSGSAASASAARAARRSARASAAAAAAAAIAACSLATAAAPRRAPAFAPARSAALIPARVPASRPRCAALARASRRAASKARWNSAPWTSAARSSLMPLSFPIQ